MSWARAEVSARVLADGLTSNAPTRPGWAPHPAGAPPPNWQGGPSCSASSASASLPSSASNASSAMEEDASEGAWDTSSGGPSSVLAPSEALSTKLPPSSDAPWPQSDSGPSSCTARCKNGVWFELPCAGASEAVRPPDTVGGSLERCRAERVMLQTADVPPSSQEDTHCSGKGGREQAPPRCHPWTRPSLPRPTERRPTTVPRRLVLLG